MFKYFVIFSLLFSSLLIKAQDDNFEYYNMDYRGLKDRVYKESVRTVKLHPENLPLSYPIIELGGKSCIELNFDDLNQEPASYSYTLTHCNAQWEESDIFDVDYIDGYTEVDISDYKYSMNTNQSYIHYSLKIPNEKMAFKLSGNYILKVFEDYDQEKVVLTKRFCVVEPKVSIDTDIHRATWVDKKQGGQEIDFSINNPNYDISNPMEEVVVVITQNNRWDKAVYDLKPKFIIPGKIGYNYDDENVFEGGNEFRYFDCKNIKFQSIRVQSIAYQEPFYHFFLHSDNSRTRKIFSHHEDLNGHNYINIERRSDSSTEADYIFVHFTLSYPPGPIGIGEVYILGDLTNWNFSPEYKMDYNLNKRAYEKTLFLKQGYYNYMYSVLDRKTKKANDTFIEGSHFQTENDYLIYVYHRSASNRYDKLIGVKHANSIKRL